ncbi:MAG: hypothetical protein QOH43_988 [Solirubrobacteraceae bacterium]|jgi:hypothetical protein|nr:hypothetical protein [Solirubrobacteraceae bacterium]
MPTIAPARAIEDEAAMPPLPEPPEVGRRTSPALRRALTLLAGVGGVVTVLFGAQTLIGLLATHTTESRASYAGVRTIDLTGAAGDVRVTAGAPGSRVAVLTRVRRGIQDPVTAASVRGGTLHLRSSCPWIGSVSCTVSYRLQIPDGLPVRVAASAGDVSVDGLSASSLDLHSDAGDVRATGVRADRITADSSAGDVLVDVVAPPTDLLATSSAGDVHVTLPDAVYDLRADTSAGDRRVDGIRQDPASTRHVTARSSAGDVVIRLRR